ncbi:MAG: sulfotransferase family protein [Flavobacteriales bacterium]|nr:sulfotransferase family protein [Flavobacteriales bacterium]
MKRICMWSGPRNLSTAMMYSFFHRGDCHVIDEPFYAHYLVKTGLNHPGREEVIAQHETDVSQVIDSLVSQNYEQEMLFIKNMPHHMVDLDLGFMEQLTHFFLIREPRAMIASYAQKIPDVHMRDLGLDLQYEMFSSLRNGTKIPPVVDSRMLLENPRSVLQRLCKALEIPFVESMLSWPAGPIPGDGAWAQYWYGSVHRSTGWDAPRALKEIRLPEHLESLVTECEKYYEEMKTFAIS